jgi:hypothetical protein
LKILFNPWVVVVVKVTQEDNVVLPLINRDPRLIFCTPNTLGFHPQIVERLQSNLLKGLFRDLLVILALRMGFVHTMLET